MSKRNKSHKKGRATSNKEKRKELKKQKYANMRESVRGTEVNTDSNTKVARGRLATGSTRYCKHKRRKERQANAVENRLAWHNKTPIDKLRELDFRLGVNLGATRERKRLKDQIYAEYSQGK